MSDSPEQWTVHHIQAGTLQLGLGEYQPRTVPLWPMLTNCGLQPADLRSCLDPRAIRHGDIVSNGISQDTVFPSRLGRHSVAQLGPERRALKSIAPVSMVGATATRRYLWEPLLTALAISDLDQWTDGTRMEISTGAAMRLSVCERPSAVRAG